MGKREMVIVALNYWFLLALNRTIRYTGISIVVLFFLTPIRLYLGCSVH
jgi:hypothetical protein